MLATVDQYVPELVEVRYATGKRHDTPTMKISALPNVPVRTSNNWRGSALKKAAAPRCASQE